MLLRMSVDVARASTVLANLSANIGLVLRGQEGPTRRLLAAFAAGGHVLLDDFPGTGKTTLAKTLALSIDARFTRIQFLEPSSVSTNAGVAGSPLAIFASGTRRAAMATTAAIDLRQASPAR